jgi:sortase (surface protein transpeptidase)
MSRLGRAVGRQRRVLLAIAAVLALGGAAATVTGFAVQQHPPAPPPSAASPVAPHRPLTSTSAPSPSTPSQGSASQGSAGTVLPAATPTTLDIPAIGVHHQLMVVGENPDGTLQVPPLSDVATPGWDKFSPSPGQLGPSVIVGHVDSAAQGKGVFFDLGALRPGNTVSVTRSDGSVAIFLVAGVDEYAKSKFPTLQVYGNTPDAELRLITCGGAFDSAAHSYVDNIVVYAKLSGSHPD